MIRPLGRMLVMISLIGTATSVMASPFEVNVALGYSGTSGSVIVAQGGKTPTISMFRKMGGEKAWSIPGPPEPSTVIISDDGEHAAVLDSYNDRAFLVSIRNGSSRMIETAATPAAALFLGDDLFVLCRDGNVLTHIASDGAQRSVDVSPDSVFAGAAEGRIHVYARREGSITSIDPASLRVVRSATLETAGSDFEVHGALGWLVVPRSGEIIVVSLHDLTEIDRLRPGAAPTDLAVQQGAGMLKGGTIAVADPGSRRVWRGESSQSELAAFGRGFLRGFLGLGLYKPRSAEYPSGVDRIWAAPWGIAAHDASGGTLYVLRDGKGAPIASGVPASAIAITADGVLFWNAAEDRITFHSSTAP